jgi:transketolase N-terminal domain/subunit
MVVVLAETTGEGLTITVAVAVAEQIKEVPVTVYVFVPTGGVRTTGFAAPPGGVDQA